MGSCVPIGFAVVGELDEIGSFIRIPTLVARLGCMYCVCSTQGSANVHAIANATARCTHFGGLCFSQLDSEPCLETVYIHSLQEAQTKCLDKT